MRPQRKGKTVQGAKGELRGGKERFPLRLNHINMNQTFYENGRKDHRNSLKHCCGSTQLDRTNLT